MATLHKTTLLVKKFLKLGVIGIVVLILIIVLVRTGSCVKEYFFPQPPPAPTVAFGKLPKMSFPPNQTTTPSTQFNYSINTLTGSLPNLPLQAKVYKIKQKESSLLDLQKAQERVKQVGFTNPPFRLNDTNYRWVHPEDSSKSLHLDIVSLNFFLYSDFKPGSAENLPSEAQAINQARSFLAQINFPQDIDSAKTKVSFLTTSQQGVFIQATSFSRANAVRVDFFQKDIDELPVFYETPQASTIHVVMSGKDFESIFKAKLHHHVIEDDYSTYPIKTAQEAFEELKKGKAYISLHKRESKDIVIKDVQLGYYSREAEEKYLLPIIVFLTDDFSAYVPAVKDEWFDAQGSAE